MAVPPSVVTAILPLVPEPTTAVIWVAESTVKLKASVSPNLTAVAPVKLVPVMITTSPSSVEDVVKEVMVGRL